MHKALLICTLVQMQGYHFCDGEPLTQRLLEAMLRECHRKFCCLCFGPISSQPICSKLLLEIRVNQVKLLAPLVWPVLNAESQRRNLIYKC